jgi:hypothetical protein
MKFWHAAALALVGWYLMVPPLTSDGKQFDANVPLAQWDARMAFDNASDCENTLYALIKDASEDNLTHQQLRHSRCIASDDPRLKEK